MAHRHTPRPPRGCLRRSSQPDHRFPVRVVRPDAGRGYSGTSPPAWCARGEVVVLPSGRHARRTHRDIHRRIHSRPAIGDAHARRRRDASAAMLAHPNIPKAVQRSRHGRLMGDARNRGRSTSSSHDAQREGECSRLSRRPRDAAPRRRGPALNDGLRSSPCSAALRRRYRNNRATEVNFIDWRATQAPDDHLARAATLARARRPRATSRAGGQVTASDRATLLARGRCDGLTGLSGQASRALESARAASVDLGRLCYVLDGDNLR